MSSTNAKGKTTPQSIMNGKTRYSIKNKKRAARTDRSVFSPHRIAYGDVCGDLLEHSDQRIRTVKPRYLSVRQGNQTPADRSILSVCDCSRAFKLTPHPAQQRDLDKGGHPICQRKKTIEKVKPRYFDEEHERAARADRSILWRM